VYCKKLPPSDIFEIFTLDNKNKLRRYSFLFQKRQIIDAITRKKRYAIWDWKNDQETKGNPQKSE
jgi:hypothetical protein